MLSVTPLTWSSVDIDAARLLCHGVRVLVDGRLVESVHLSRLGHSTGAGDHGALVLEQPFHPPVFRVYASWVFERRRSLSRIIAVKSSAGRISKGPTFTPGCFDINWMAWFRSLASSTRIPPTCSFVSAYGPSVMDTLPCFHRRVVAFRALWSASPPTK